MPETGHARQPYRPIREIVGQLCRCAWEYRGRTLEAIILLLRVRLPSESVPIAFKRIIDVFRTPGSLAEEAARRPRMSDGRPAATLRLGKKTRQGGCGAGGDLRNDRKHAKLAEAFTQRLAPLQALIR